MTRNLLRWLYRTVNDNGSQNQDVGDAIEWLDDVTDPEKAIIRRVKPYTMTSQARLVYLIRAVEYLVRNKIPGDIVECGVCRGGSMMAAAEVLQALGDTSRDLYLFDTFAGMTAPTEHDRKSRENIDVQAKWESSLSEGVSQWCFASIDHVRENLHSTGYPREKIHFTKGPVEETLQGFHVNQISLLRLDTDWYESTRCELKVLYPRVVPHGVVIIDDYGSWEGARKAVDEFLPTLANPVLLSRVDASARAWVVSP